MAASDSVIEAQGVSKTFGNGAGAVEALRGVTISVRRGEFVAVMGPSGSGKSTLLHLLGGLTAPTSGQVSVGGTGLGSLDDDALTLLRRRRIGFVFQAFNLLPLLTAAENVALPLLIDGVPEADADARAAEALRGVGLAPRASHRPGELSGGEQQRVALARAMVSDPVVILADEPTGNLDSKSSDFVMQLLRSMVSDRKQTVLMVTHDSRLASMADRIVRMRDGRLVEEPEASPARPARTILDDLGWAG